MARRKRKNDDDVSKLLLGLVVVAFILVYLKSNSLGLSAVVAGLVLAIIFGVRFFLIRRAAEKLKRSGIADIDQMDGIQFEHYLGQLFRTQGYAVQVTQAAGDFGADLVLTKDGKKTVVQAKRYSKDVGIKAVQEVQASIAHYGAAEGWVVTNSGFTEAACTLAKSNGVRLINREALIQMILQMNPGTAHSPKQEATRTIKQVAVTYSPEDEPTCERCGQPMVIRNGSKGQFYGCSSFPKCRHTKSI